jgi:nucleoside-diphosphate-sugar epimerase
MNKKFTIFGQGFVGKNLSLFLGKKNYDIFKPKKFKYKFKKNLNHVIYCIGNQNWLKDPKLTYETNLSIMVKILFNNKFKTFTLISSTRLYFANAKDKTTEDDLIKINTSSKNYLYNSLKITAENLCLSLDNENIKVVRISNLFGDNFTNQAYILPTLIRDSINKNKIGLEISRNSTKDFIHVDDAFDALVKVISKGRYRLYNIASGQNIKINEILKVIKKITNCKIHYKKNLKTIKEPKININRIRKEFNFKPKINLINSINGLIDNYKKTVT